MTYLWFIMKSEFGATLNPRWQTLQLDTNCIDNQPVVIWDHARYLIEHRMFLHKNPHKKGHAYSCITAMDFAVYMINKEVWNSTLELQRVDVVSRDMRLIIKRIPIQRPLQRYVPVRFNPTAKECKNSVDAANPINKQITEDEKIQLMIEFAGNFYEDTGRRNYIEVQKHPTEYAIGAAGDVMPAETYMCRGCGKTGEHYRSMCPNPTPEQLDRIRAPHGIPKMFLETALPGDASSFQSFTGEFVKRTPFHTLLSMAPAPVIPEPLVPLLQLVQEPLLPLVPLIPLVTALEATFIEPDLCEMDNNTNNAAVFDFETYLMTNDTFEKKSEAAFYTKHPELAQKHGSLCSYYIRGLCQKTKLECKFLHVCDSRLMPICQFFIANSCVNDPCLFRHDLQPLKRKLPCPRYKNGFCKQGPQCEMVHAREIPQNCLSFLGQVRFRLMIEALGNGKHRSKTPRNYSNHFKFI